MFGYALLNWLVWQSKPLVEKWSYLTFVVALGIIFKLNLQIKMRKFFTLLFILFAFISQAQHNDIKISDEITISGLVDKSLKFSTADLVNYEKQEIGDLVISNHLGVAKGTAKKMNGILVKRLFDDVKFKVDSPKYLSEFYLTFIATDGYKVVFSWNEIFNSATGDHVFLVTEKDGKSITEMDDRILVVTTSDFKTGRRHLKGLSEIIVSRVE